MSRGSVTPKAFDPTTVDISTDPDEFLKTLFVFFLQNLFRDVPEGSGMRWRPEEEVTDLLITGEKPVVEALEKFPHICVIIGASQYSGLGLDQLQWRSFNQGTRKHTDLVPQTVQYHCMAKSGTDARRIARFAAHHTMILRRILHRLGNLHHVDPKLSITAEGPPGAIRGPTGDTDAVGVVVTVPFYWQVQWHITEPSTLWRRLRLELSVEKHHSIYRASAEKEIRPPTVKGKPVVTRPISGGTPGEKAFTQVVLETSLEGEE